MIKIDFNCDLGEISDGGALDAAVLPEITSANVACGFHAGGPAEMERTVSMAKLCGCAVGAHPGFPDRENFGRTEMDVTPAQVKGYIIYQLGALGAFCRAAQLRMSHVKAHGALYNMAARDYALAEAICEGVASVDPSLILLGLSGSLMQDAAANTGLAFASEVFADRAYMPDGSLVSRKAPGAVITDMETIARRVVRMAKEGVVEAIDGTVVPIRADSVCLHGDNPGAASFAAKIRAALEGEGVKLAPLWEILQ